MGERAPGVQHMAQHLRGQGKLQPQRSASKYPEIPGAQLMSKPRFGAVVIQLSEQVPWLRGVGPGTVFFRCSPQCKRGGKLPDTPCPTKV